MALSYTVYILQYNDNAYHTGFTTNIEQRLKAH
ncbi:GIY-YIG nuclease family protein [Winogradskyella pelagia]